jgi:predicted branched-subunit amino acid permease
MKNDFLKGFQETIPISLPCIVYGALLNYNSSLKGFSVLEVIGMAILLFAGSSQFLIVAMWENPLYPLEILIAVIAINFRYILMTASLNSLFRGESRLCKITTIHFVADENWAITISKLKKSHITSFFLLGGGFCILTLSCIGMVIDNSFRNIISMSYFRGIDLIVAMVFAIMLPNFHENRVSLFSWICASIVAYVGFIVIPGKWYIILGSITGIICYGLGRGHSNNYS